ncbi:MAG: DUF4886 domain-containing protein [Chitinophagales bacterium]
MKQYIYILFTFVFCQNLLTATTYQALFIGNSYTYYNDLPDLVNKIANSFGDTVLYNSSTFGGYTFQQHATNSSTIDKINSENWDFIVLQEQSQIPSFPPTQVATDCYPYAEQLVDLIENNSNCSKALFFMTWGRQNGDAANCAFYEPLCTYEGMQQRLTESYTEMAALNEASVAPVGVAWQEVREQTEDAINLYSSDGSHPSIYGSYLAACVFYSTMFQKTTLGAFSPSEINETDAEILQNMASETVLNDLPSWFIEEIENPPVPCACSFLENAADFEMLEAVCENGEAFVLGSAADENDYFEGTAVSVLGENYVFNPSLAIGNNEVTHIVSNGDCEDIAMQNITVFDFVVAGFNDLDDNYTTADEPVILVPNDENGEHIFMGEGVENGIFYPNLVSSLNETINITQIVTNGLCTDSTSQSLVVGFPLHVENLAAHEVEIYPTISRSAIFIHASNFELETLELFDMSGQKVKQQIIFEEIEKTVYKIDVSQLQKACYIVRVGIEDAFLSKKIVVCD